MSPGAMIQTVELTKSYRNVAVLRGVSLEVAAGSIHGFVGPNGAGKSTFLKCLIGVVRPDSGTVRVAGIDARQDSLAVRRRVGYAPAETALYNRMRADDLVRFSIQYHADADPARALDLLEIFQVPRRRRVGALSHGMKRKLLLTQAIASGAPLLMLDEPMEALDLEARRLVESMLLEDAAGGRTVFLSSHDLISTQRLCSYVTFLHRGDVLRDGPMSDMLAGLPGLLHVHFRTSMTAGDLSATGLQWRGHDLSWQVSFTGPLEATLAQLIDLPIAGLRDDSGNLESLFDHLYERQQEVRA